MYMYFLGTSSPRRLRAPGRCAPRCARSSAPATKKSQFLQQLKKN